MKKKSEKGPVMVCMGRRVIHNSPAKHPTSTDPLSPEAFDQMIEEVAKRQSGTLGGVRQDQKPMQRESPGAAKRLQEGIDYLYEAVGGKRKK